MTEALAPTPDRFQKAIETRRRNDEAELREIKAEQTGLNLLRKIAKREGRPTQEIHLAIQQLGKRRRILEGRLR